MRLVTDPAGRFSIRATKRSVELWIVQPIAFDKRPSWQSSPDGPVAHLHRALSELEPEKEDVLACIWACSDEEQKLDVENRLFTNVLPKFTGAPRGPNPFAGLPKRVRFERSYHCPRPDGFDTGPCTYYRYALSDPGGSWENWRVPEDGERLASWLNVPARGLTAGNGWPTWASMRDPDAQVVARSGSKPYRDEFALRLVIHTPRTLQLIANMEWIVDGVVASFQQEADPARAEAVARLIRPSLKQHRQTHDLVAAQCTAPRLFADPPFRLNPSRSRCQINPADHQLVAGDIELTVLPQRACPVLSGTLHPVDRT